MGEVIKEFLVSLGFQIDKAGAKEAEKTVDSLQKSLDKIGLTMKRFIRFKILSKGFKMLKQWFNKTVKASQELNYSLEETAKKLGKTAEETRTYKLALSAMGKTIEEINKSKKLKAVYDDLTEIGKQLALPQGAEGLQVINNIQDELTKLKFVGAYAVEWLRYKFQVLAAGPLSRIAGKLNSFKDWFGKNVEKITQKLAEPFAYATQVFDSIVSVLGKIASKIESLPDTVKNALGAAGVFLLAFKTKWGGAFLVISAILLLLDDLVVYLEGGESRFGDFWEPCVEWATKAYNWISDVVGKISQFVEDHPFISDAVKNFVAAWLGMGTVVTTFYTLKNVIGLVTKAMDPTTLILSAIIGFGIAIIENWDDVKKYGIKAWDKIKEVVTKCWEGIKSAWDSCVDFFVGIWNGIKDGARKLWEGEDGNGGVKGFFVDAWGSVKSTWETATGFFEGIWTSVKSTFSGAADSLAKVFTDAYDGVTKIWDGISSYVSDLFNEVVNYVIDAINECITAVNSVAGWLWGDIGLIDHVGKKNVGGGGKSTNPNAGGGFGNGAGGTNSAAGGAYDSILAASGYGGGTIDIEAAAAAFGALSRNPAGGSVGGAGVVNNYYVKMGGNNVAINAQGQDANRLSVTLKQELQTLTYRRFEEAVR